MGDLLFLAHRIPYPPNKGDKIRSFHILRHLATRHRVHLGAFVDDPEDWQHVEFLESLCASVKLIALDRRIALLRSVSGLVRGEALGVPFYRDGEMRSWVAVTRARHTISSFFVFSSTMAQYLNDVTTCDSVLDLCDVDSEKWAQYAARHRFPMSWVYRREARLLAEAERSAARNFRSVVLVSAAEAALFKTVAPTAAAKTSAIRNGVDTVFFDPAGSFADPYPATHRAIVFTGAMDYWANADAVSWFANEVLPAIRAQDSNAHFYIVGSRPTAEVQKLASLAGVTVTGTVPDVRPYLRHAAVVVAPLRIARGIQNKVLEALAMAKPLVATPAALDGLDAIAESGARGEDEPSAFANAVIEALRAQSSHRPEAREYVCARYGWEATLRALDHLLPSRPASVAA